LPGEREAWRTWLDRHGPGLVLFARQWSRTRADAEDAVQDGFLRFWRSPNRGGKSAGYLFAAVRSAAIDMSRSERSRERRERVRAAESSEFAGASDWFSPQHLELAAAVQSALEKLPPEQREVIVMKIWADLSFAEIAEALAISPNTAASRYRYALQKLESELAEEVARD
jgi:RNA polymerase sigma-70 factor, ECF subfamily